MAGAQGPAGGQTAAAAHQRARAAVPLRRRRGRVLDVRAGTVATNYICS